MESAEPAVVAEATARVATATAAKLYPPPKYVYRQHHFVNGCQASKRSKGDELK